MKTASLTCNTGEFVLNKKKNSMADTFGKYLNKSSYNNRMIKYVVPVVALVLVGAQLLLATQLAYAESSPYWMPFTMKGASEPVKFITVRITNATDELGLTKITLADLNTTHVASHYMNASEEEIQPADAVFTADAGAFVFHPGKDINKDDTMEICFRSLTLERGYCFYFTNYNPTTTTNVEMDVGALLAKDSVSALVNQGNTLLSQGNYTQAVQFFDKALDLDPRDKYALEHKGYALYHLGNYSEALQYLDKSLAIDSNYKEALNEKGVVLESSGNNTQAIQYYDKALAIDPNDSHVLSNKASALVNLGKSTEAVQYYDKALAIDPNNELVLSNKGFALNDLENYTVAIQSFDKALAVDPNDKYALHGKGDALDKLGNRTGAIQTFDRALAIDPKYEAALYDKGLTLSNIGNYAEATQYYDKALMIDPKNIHLLTDKGNALTNLGNYTQAIQYFNKSLAIDQNDSDALKGKQNAISKLIASTPTSGYGRGCSDSQISNPSDRYINQSEKGPKFHSKAFMQAYIEGFGACSSNLTAATQARDSFDTGSQLHKSYWSPTNLFPPSGMKVLHVIFDGTDSTFRLGNKGLKACIDNTSNKGGSIICHSVRKIPVGKNGTVDTGYFIVPKTNETLYASGKVDFDGISVGTQVRGSDTHVDLPSGVYNDVSTGIWCLEHEKVKLNSPAMTQCIIKHD